ncbi:acyl-CoA reductase-like NAD-dependent aldehyde dehydrogenase [Virgibacillus halotolerans]|nr:acyl-CoA reductase-like NAD-dependent aldehyde dehydrogenase [Virgibacillus halotolerans]
MHIDRDLEVFNPYNQEVIDKISCAMVDDVEKAVQQADEVFQRTMKKMPALWSTQYFNGTGTRVGRTSRNPFQS